MLWYRVLARRRVLLCLGSLLLFRSSVNRIDLINCVIESRSRPRCIKQGGGLDRILKNGWRGSTRRVGSSFFPPYRPNKQRHMVFF